MDAARRKRSERFDRAEAAVTTLKCPQEMGRLVKRGPAKPMCVSSAKRLPAHVADCPHGNASIQRQLFDVCTLRVPLTEPEVFQLLCACRIYMDNDG